MKLYTTDNSELMEITEINAFDGNLIVTGTIMGAVPVKAVLKPEDMRAAFKQMSLPTMAKAAVMPMRGTSAVGIIGGTLVGLYSLFRVSRKK